jgi:glycine cleavage system H protein
MNKTDNILEFIVVLFYFKLLYIKINIKMLRYLNCSLKYNFLNKTKFSQIILRNFSKLYTKEHEWVSVDKGSATIGITDHAQSELGEIVHVDLPKVGDSFKIGESLGAVESVKTAADIYSPVEGTVSEVNEKLTKTPNLLNSHALSQGWYAKLKIDESMNEELAKLMSEEQYHKYLEELKN